MVDHASSVIGVAVALPEERAALEDLLRQRRMIRRRGVLMLRGTFEGRPLVIVQSGMGRVRAQRAAETLLAEWPVSRLLAVGFSGALDPALAVGDLVLADRVIEDDGGAVLVVNGTVPVVPTARRGAVVTVDKVYATVEEKQALAKRRQALAVDMESSAVARAAAARGVPWYSLRVILDPLGTELVVRSRRAAAIALLRPKRVKKLLQLARDVRQVSRRLAVGLVALLAHLELTQESGEPSAS
jgi:adenosylhomocysteine nucleosidase